MPNAHIIADYSDLGIASGKIKTDIFFNRVFRMLSSTRTSVVSIALPNSVELQDQATPNAQEN